MNEERKSAIVSKFDALGEVEVRHKLKMNYWLRGSPETALAEEWVRQREQAREDDFNSRNFKVARSAKNAAWIAAAMAIIAAMAAIVPAVMPYLSSGAQ